MALKYASRMDKVRPSAIRDLLRYGADPSITSFGGGYPDPALFPLADLRTVYDTLLADHGARALQYTVSDGLPELRAHVARRMTADGAPCHPEEILIIQGAQQGLDLAAKLVLDQGDTVIVEDPTFLGALIAFNPCEPNYATVRIDAHGMDMDHLEAVLEASPRAKMIYTVPDFQNPSGVTMSLERRRRLIELANRYDLLVLEDAPYRALRLDGDTVPSLKSLDTQGRVIHLGSFSKILAPGMRLGWAAASGEIITKLALLKLAADTQCSTLNMAATVMYLDRFDLDAHIRSVRSAYCRKRALMFEVLDSAFPEQIAYTRSEGGLFTWLSFPENFDTARFMLEHSLPKAKVAYVPGATFFAVDQQTQHARFNFSALPDETLISGMERLGALVTQTLR